MPSSCKAFRIGWAIFQDGQTSLEGSDPARSADRQANRPLTRSRKDPMGKVTMSDKNFSGH